MHCWVGVLVWFRIVTEVWFNLCFKKFVNVWIIDCHVQEMVWNKILMQLYIYIILYIIQRSILNYLWVYGILKYPYSNTFFWLRCKEKRAFTSDARAWRLIVRARICRFKTPHSSLKNSVHIAIIFLNRSLKN